MTEPIRPQTGAYCSVHTAASAVDAAMSATAIADADETISRRMSFVVFIDGPISRLIGKVGSAPFLDGDLVGADKDECDGAAQNLRGEAGIRK